MGVFTNRNKFLWPIVLVAVLVTGTGSYITPRLTQAGQINLNTGTEPRSLSDIINFTQKSNLVESQLAPLSSSWEQALRTVNRYPGTSQIYKESCSRYNCTGGPPLPKDVEIAKVGLPSPFCCASPSAVAVDATFNRVWVTEPGNGNVTILDGNSNTVIKSIALGANPGAGQSFGVAVYGFAYVSNYNSGTVSLVGPSDYKLAKTVSVGTNPEGIASGTFAEYVANYGSGTVSVIDRSSLNVVKTLGVGSQPSSIAADFVTGFVYVTNSGSNSVSVINGIVSATNSTVVKTITQICPGTQGSFPEGVSVNPSNDRVYVTCSGSTVSVIDGSPDVSQFTVVATIPLPGVAGLIGVNNVGVNPRTNHIYVSNGFSTFISVIDGNSNSVIANVTVGSGPSGVGFDSDNGLVYVADANENTVSVIGQREEMRESCQNASADCLVVTSTGTLLPGTAQSTSVNLVGLSFRSGTTKTGTQMAVTILCDNNTTNSTRQCSAFYVDGNVWGPDHTDMSKSPFIIQNAEPYFYLQFHWWDFNNSRIVVWSTWWYGTASNPNWYWGVYWWWRTYVNYYIGIWLPWWWWTWHWTYWRYWGWWGTAFQT